MLHASASLFRHLTNRLKSAHLMMFGFKSLVILLLAVSANTASTVDEDTPTIKPAPPFPASTLLEPPTSAWLTNGGDLYNRNFSPLNRITRDNVNGLKAKWRIHLEGSGIGPQYSGESQPIIYDGVIYIITGADDVFAVSVETGEIIWRYSANINPDVSTICCGWTSRGVALGNGMVFVGQLDGKLVALDQMSGDIRWSIQSEQWQQGYTITSAPLYYNDMVITGFAGAEFGTRGRVKAYDAKDGTLIWTFYTIPAPGEYGHDTWSQDNDIWKHGGGTVWQTPAVDPELGLLYFSTGNPGPDFNGSVRKGDNLFTNSIVAIDVTTGTYRWHFQQVHHDIWDYDSANPVVLFDTEIDGVIRKAIVQVSKTGWAYILDRTNGQPLIGIEERPVMQEPRQSTTATQPFPIGDAIGPQTLDIAPEGYALVNDGHIFTPFWTDRIAVKRTEANWPPSAYDPSSQNLYICATERTFYFNAKDDLEGPVEGEIYFGGNFGTLSFPAFGILAALNMNTNRIAWQQRWPDRCYSGVIATAGKLIFVGRNDGRLLALDSSSGDKLWEFQTDAGINAPASSFNYKGEQYVTVLSAGNLFAGSKRGDSLWLFSLSGTIDQNMISETESKTTDQVATSTGNNIYAQACQFCHGAKGDGGHNGVSLVNREKSGVSHIRQIIKTGLNAMPAFEDILTEEELDAVAYFVYQL